MSHAIESRVADLVHMLEYKAGQLYPSLVTSGADADRTQVSLKILGQLGLVVHQETRGAAVWIATKELLRDFDCIAMFNGGLARIKACNMYDQLPANMQISDFANNKWVYNKLAWLAGDGVVEAAESPILSPDGLTYEDAFRQTCRFCYAPAVLALAILWEALADGRVARRKNRQGVGEWAPSPYRFFTEAVAIENDGLWTLIADLKAKGLVDRNAKRSSEESIVSYVTHQGAEIGLLSDTMHLLDVLDRVGISIAKH